MLAIVLQGHKVRPLRMLQYIKCIESRIKIIEVLDRSTSYISYPVGGTDMN